MNNNKKNLSILLLLSLFAINTILVAQPKLVEKDGDKIAMPQNNAYGVPDKIQNKINIFFRQVFKENFQDAYKGILIDSELGESTEKVEKLIKETKRIKKFYGKLSGYEFVNSEAATKSYIRVRCLGLCEHYPMRWIFTFYKSPKSSWVITNIKFDDLSEYYFTD